MSVPHDGDKGHGPGRRLSEQARDLARATMHQRGVFNRYLRQLRRSPIGGLDDGWSSDLLSDAPPAAGQVAALALRQEFLQILPDYALRNGLDRTILIEVGVPPADLDEAGLAG